MAQIVCVILTASEKARERAISENRARLLKHVQRAHIVLLRAERLPVLDVAHQAGVSRTTACRRNSAQSSARRACCRSLMRALPSAEPRAYRRAPAGASAQPPGGREPTRLMPGSDAPSGRHRAAPTAPVVGGDLDPVVDLAGALRHARDVGAASLASQRLHLAVTGRLGVQQAMGARMRLALRLGRLRCDGFCPRDDGRLELSGVFGGRPSLASNSATYIS